MLDTSSSMTGQKLEDAKEAALLFVGMIDLAPGRSQVAVVRYDREAEVVRELTRSRALIDAAIRSLQVRSGTHIDKGLRAALGELQSPRHVDRNTPVMILLTDGLQTGTPGEELRAAAEVRDAGVRLYTIGLGSDVDETALKTMAGDESRYYHAPDSADLAQHLRRDRPGPDVSREGVVGRRRQRPSEFREVMPMDGLTSRPQTARQEKRPAAYVVPHTTGQSRPGGLDRQDQPSTILRHSCGIRKMV